MIINEVAEQREFCKIITAMICFTTGEADNTIGAIAVMRSRYGSRSLLKDCKW